MLFTFFRTYLILFYFVITIIIPTLYQQNYKTKYLETYYIKSSLKIYVLIEL